MKLKNFAIVCAAILASTVAARAFVPAMPVIDVAAVAEAVTTNAHLIDKIRRFQRQYEHWLKQAQIVEGVVTRYRTDSSAFKPFITSDTYLKAGVWIDAANSGNNARTGWQQATEIAVGYLGAIGNVPPNQVGRRQRDYTSLELQDGAGIAALEAIGGVRRHGRQYERTIRSIEGDVLSDDEDAHTEAAQAQTANAIGVAQSRQLSSITQLLISNTEMQLAELKTRRDAHAYGLIVDAEVKSRGAAALETFNRDGSAAIQAWRLP